MNHLMIEKFDSLTMILERFFKLNYRRSSIPAIYPEDELNVFNLACQIYKRGFISLSHSLLGELKQQEIPSTAKRQSAVLAPRAQTYKSFINELFQYGKHETFFLIDKNFLSCHPVLGEFLANKNFYPYLPSESTKNLSTVKCIMETIPPKVKCIFVMGGGVTLDIGGFIAGLLNLPVHYLSTTLLSSVDASIGGKTGVNFSPYGKNQIGLFYEASSLYVVPDFLTTLKQEKKLCGVVEAAKHAYLFGELTTDLPILKTILSNTISSKELRQIVNKNLHYKSFVVQLDPKEKNGIRASLNFGHTLAHIIEALAEEQYVEFIPHGLAVAHGIKFLFDFQLIEQIDAFNSFLYEIVSNAPIVIKKQISLDVIARLLSQDKKNTAQEKCALSLPNYGLFTLRDGVKRSKPTVDKILKEYLTIEISQLILNYLCKFL